MYILVGGCCYLLGGIVLIGISYYQPWWYCINCINLHQLLPTCAGTGIKRI